MPMPSAKRDLLREFRPRAFQRREQESNSSKDRHHHSQRNPVSLGTCKHRDHANSSLPVHT